MNHADCLMFAVVNILISAIAQNLADLNMFLKFLACVLALLEHRVPEKEKMFLLDQISRRRMKIGSLDVPCSKYQQKKRTMKNI